MSAQLFVSAHPYQTDVLALPVTDLDAAASYYAGFGLAEVERTESAVIMERDGVRIGFAITGGDASQDGAAIRVTDIERAAAELRDAGVSIGEFRTDERDGETLRVFFVVAPDGLCYYFHQPVAAD